MLRRFYDPLACLVIRFIAVRLARFLADVERSDPAYGRELCASVLKMLEA